MKKLNISSRTVWMLIGAVLFIMSVALVPISPVLAFMHFSIVLAIGTLGFIEFWYDKNYILNVSENVKKFFSGNSGDILEAVPMPTIIVSTENINEILFYNDNFKNVFLDRGYCSVNGLKDILPRESAETLLSKTHTAVKIGEESYKLYIRKFFDFIILYFKDDTNYRNLKQKFIESRICVGYISFDNKEELKQTLSEEQILYISLGLEDKLQKWMSSAEGALEKISDGRYVAFFQEKYLKKFMDEKFEIIEKIHEIKSPEGKYATISVGISRGADTLEKSKNQAKNALNMALGRGGDQAAVKNKNSYEFFGGNSVGLEKRSKVRTRVVAKALLEKIETAENVLVMGHKFSDFDSVGASAALCSICLGIKKKSCYVVVNKSQTLALELIKYLESYRRDVFVSPEYIKNIVTSKTLLIVVDTHSADFLEDKELYRKCANIVVIDHHRMHVNKIQNAEIFFHEPFASSVSEMVTEMIQYMNGKLLKKPEADALLAGITLDTKNFSLKTGIRTFEAAAYLKKKGADTLSVKKLFSNSLDSYKLRCKIIENCEMIEGCAVACTESGGVNFKISCAQAADELLNIKNVKASFVIFKNNGIINISARSMGDVNVQVIMEKFGGGGHQTMAAAQLDKVYDIKRARSELIEILKENNSNSKKDGD